MKESLFDYEFFNRVKFNKEIILHLQPSSLMKRIHLSIDSIHSTIQVVLSSKKHQKISIKSDFRSLDWLLTQLDAGLSTSFLKKIKITSISEIDDEFEEIKRKYQIDESDESDESDEKDESGERDGSDENDYDENKSFKKKFQPICLSVSKANQNLVICSLIQLIKNQRFITKIKFNKVLQPDLICSELLNCDFKFIQSLNLLDNNISEEGAFHISKMKLNYLNQLDIRKNPFGTRGLKHICKASWPRLIRAQIGVNKFSVEGLKYLKKTVYHLEQLHIYLEYSFWLDRRAYTTLSTLPVNQVYIEWKGIRSPNRLIWFSKPLRVYLNSYKKEGEIVQIFPQMKAIKKSNCLSKNTMQGKVQMQIINLIWKRSILIYFPQQASIARRSAPIPEMMIKQFWG